VSTYEQKKIYSKFWFGCCRNAYSGYLYAGKNEFPVVRTPVAQRKFTSTAVENLIAGFRSFTPNKELAWLFENCFPNTLDTTVDFEMLNGKPDSYVITGDIDAMWLRDSTAQVWPYLSLIKEDKKLKELVAGVINRQISNILYDPMPTHFIKTDRRGESGKMMLPI
jgi:meiotically up-regulated gene 157 (Mug157) protein